MASFKVPEEQLLDGVEQTNRLLGTGGYGCVFLGKWRGISVAVKRHHPVLLRDENGDLSVPYLRFLEEFPLLRDYPHPSIVQVFGMVPPTCPQDSFGLVMEYLPVTLLKRYGQTPLLTDAQEILIALSVINGLDFLHKRGVIHRDITTSNIMLTEAAGTGTVRAKITDVGVARILEGATQAAQSMSLNPGAQVYMAPETQLEVHQSLRAWYSPAADIYSFGVTILAMCNRHEPPDLFKLARQGRTNDVAKLRTDHPLRPAIVICLQEEAGNRPNATSLSADIVAIQNQVSLGAETRRESVSQESRHNTQSGNGDADDDRVAILRAERDEAIAMRDQHEGARQRAVMDRNAVADERDRAIVELDRVLVEQTHLTEQIACLTAQWQQQTENYDQLKRANDILTNDLARLQEDRQRLVAERNTARATLHRSQQATSDVPPAAAGVEHPAGKKQKPSAAMMQVIKESVEKSTGISRVLFGDSGELARCKRLFAVGNDIPDIADSRPWLCIGNLPAVACYACLHPCIHNEYLYCCFDKEYVDTSPGKLYRIPVKKIGSAEWAVIALPDGEWHGNVYCFTFDQDLYIAAAPFHQAAPYQVYKMLGVTGHWRYVTAFPEKCFAFGLANLESGILIAGGRTELHAGASIRSTHHLNLMGELPQWNQMPELPCDCLFPSAVSLNNSVHLFGYYASHGPQTTKHCSVISLDLDLPWTVHHWTLDLLPPVPCWCCGAVALNGHVVVVGGFKKIGNPVDNTYMYIKETREWLPLSDLRVCCSSPRCMTVNNKVYVIGGSTGSALCNIIEVLSADGPQF